MFGTIKDWYERPLKAVINGVEIDGYVDFMVTHGIKKPQRPYDQYEYHVSKVFDNTWLADLKQIYINLQAVKYCYCKD